ncbi:MAG TPA: hypothetical protein VIM69_06730, partial [Opitutaceae bacterium]
GVGVWVERRAPRELRLYFALAPLAIGAVLWFYQVQLETYRGLSGVAAGLVVFYSWIQFRERKTGIAIVVFLSTAAKLLLETTSHRALLAHFEKDAIRPTVAAHLTGLVVALILCAGSTIFTPLSPVKKLVVRSGNLDHQDRTQGLGFKAHNLLNVEP